MCSGENCLINFINSRLKAVLMRHLPREGFFRTGIPGVMITRHDKAGIIEHRFDHPVVALLVQGAKQTLIGSREYTITPNQILTIGVDMPSSSRLIETNPEKPLLTIFFDINQKTVGDLLLEMGYKTNYATSPTGVSVENAGEEFLERIFRLASLMDKPEQIPVHANMILAELHYLLLTGPQENVMRNLYGTGTDGHQILSAIEFLKTHIDVPVRLENVACAAHMSKTSLHRYFKTLTGLSPLQYHKFLRLHEACRLILAENEQSGIAAMKVGYESVTQFNREYKRLFGQPPHKSKKQNR